MKVRVAETRYLVFSLLGRSASGKTDEFAVDSKGDAFLGRIRWYAPWRCYVFYPALELFNVACLRDVADFIAMQMDRRRRNAR